MLQYQASSLISITYESIQNSEVMTNPAENQEEKSIDIYKEDGADMMSDAKKVEKEVDQIIYNMRLGIGDFFQ